MVDLKYRLVFRDEAGHQRVLYVTATPMRPKHRGALGKLWRQRADYIIICVLFVSIFILSLKVTGWF